MQSFYPKTLLILASLQAMLAVIAGAFGAHALEVYLPVENLTWWETGCRYLMYHSLAALLCAWASQQLHHLRYSALLFTLGNILFAGSLWFMALSSNKDLALLTPLGGLLYLVGWVYMVMCFLKSK